MANAGDVFTSSMRYAAQQSTALVLGRARDAAALVGDEALAAVAREPFDMVPITQAQFDWVVARGEDSLVYVDDGSCFNRAMKLLHELNQRLRVGTSPLDDRFAGAIAVNPKIAAHTTGPEAYTGGFHAAFAARVIGHDEVQIADLLKGYPRQESVSDWAKRRIAKEGDVRLLRPWSGTGLWNGVRDRSEWVGPGYFDGAIEHLNGAWDLAPTYGISILGHPRAAA